MLSKPPSSHPEIPSSRRGLGLTLLTRTKNPTHLVRALYLSPLLAPHTFLSGETAEEIGESLGEILVDPSYFYTDHRWREHRRGLGLPEDPPPNIPEPGPSFSSQLDQLPTGTVGAVALDVRGCIASLTSTGGRTNKLVGRIGDTPLMGAGFWAEEWNEDSGWVRRCWNKFRGYQSKRAVGVSGTGDGDVGIEVFSQLVSLLIVTIVFHQAGYSVKHRTPRALFEAVACDGFCQRCERPCQRRRDRRRYRA